MSAERNIFFASSVGLTAGLAFLYGIYTGYYEVWPYPVVRQMKTITESLVVHGDLVPLNRRHEAPADAPREDFTVHQADARAFGYYAVLGWNDETETYAVWLYDSDGTRHHLWSIDYAGIDPDGPRHGSDAPHGFHVLRDGSIVVGFDNGDVMARLDTCGQPLWTRTGFFHHAITQAQDGNLWTWYAEDHAYGHYQYILKVDALSGETLERIGLVEDIIGHSATQRDIFGIPRTFDFRWFRDEPPSKADDLFHPNDVDELSEDVAAVFPMFDSGDLILSFRNLHLVTVIDRDTHAVKWWRRGPWIFQHDPEFRTDGLISVFSNNTDSRGTSEIITIDPGTDAVSNPLNASAFTFYTRSRGKHSYLPNGNLLVVIPEEGRAVELSPSGTRVLEINNVYPDKPAYNDDITNVKWFAPTYFEQMPACPARKGIPTAGVR